MSYASGTSVSVERSRQHVEQLLLAKGAGQIMSAFDVERGTAIIGWTMGGRMVRVSIPLPDQREEAFTHRLYRGRPTGTRIPLDIARARWEQACRARWRAIVLILKAKFEAIEAGVSTFESEFLSGTVMADGRTVGAWIQPQLESMYSTGRMPALLPETSS